jgi:hypothetical protein
MAGETKSDPDNGDDLPTLEASVSEVLAALTARSPSALQPPEDTEYPHPEGLASANEDE